MLPKVNPTHTKTWAKLKEAAKQPIDIRSLLETDKKRVQKMSFNVENLFVDFSKNDLDDSIMKDLLSLCDDCQLKTGIEALFNGDKINETEQRSVLHMDLRDPAFGHYPELIGEELKKIKKFSNKVFTQQAKGYTGKAITDIVNIGIGGSDLGPKMVCASLRDYWKDVTPHFISNVDAAQLDEVLQPLHPETTLFIIASKTFTTQETMSNALSAKAWFLAEAKDERFIKEHFVAVSTNLRAVTQFGISESCMFKFWDWVGGRYSLWSAIGLSIACTVGYEAFTELLAGANKMDNHFRHTDFEKNLPVISALIGVWHNNFKEYDTQAILPYDHRLRFLPTYLQQADMESNGKSCDRNGHKTHYQTGSIVWGEAGTNGQHAFYQLIHQGSKIVPCEFIAFANPAHKHTDHHDKLMANFFAQPEALLKGKSVRQIENELVSNDNEEIIPFKYFEGNRPSTSILIDQLTPYNLGLLIAMYEHKIFVQGLIWNIFSFDQWGVELGKQLATPILNEIRENKKTQIHDSSTSSLLNQFFNLRRK